MLTLKEIAWLAGLLEGEGSFGAYVKGSQSPCIQFSMCDKDVLERAANMLGGPVKDHPYDQRRHPNWSMSPGELISTALALSAG